MEFPLTGNAAQGLGSNGCFAHPSGAPRTDTAFENKEVTVPVEPGKYHLALVVKDVGSGLTGTEYTSVEVPTFEELTVNQ